MTRARRIVAVVLAGVVLPLGAVLAIGAGDEQPRRWYVELDNAFGLSDGGDVKIAGVRAGKIEKIGLQRKGMRARLSITVADTGFGDLRDDATCESRPQSLIGEYFLDCNPGTSDRRLPVGGTIPVERTSSTIPIDLIQNIMRRPVRERFSIFLSELGIGLAGRGQDLNETIRRANPALRETSKLLQVLADERRVIRDLYADADEILFKLRERKQDITRYIAEARDTARASARDEPALARTFNLLPTFLQELTPTMQRLEEAAGEQRPAVNALGREAPRILALLNALGPFSDASRPATRALAQAARTSRPAIKAARGPVKTLRGAVRPLPEAATNLAFIFQHVDDPKFAVEKDARAGREGGGFTGLEALLRYVWSQSQAINVHDSNSYSLKVALFADRVCGSYANAAIAKDPANARCRAWLGGNQPGVTTPDPTRRSTASATAASRALTNVGRRPVEPHRPPTSEGPAAPAATTAAAPGTGADAARPQEQLRALIDRAAGATALPAPSKAGEQALLDFLLAP